MQLRRAVEMGCYFSVNGAMIKSQNGQNLIKSIPMNRLLVETDAPFVGDVKNTQQLVTELRMVEKSLVSILGSDIIEFIHSNSRDLLCFGCNAN